MWDGLQMRACISAKLTKRLVVNPGGTLAGKRQTLQIREDQTKEVQRQAQV